MPFFFKEDCWVQKSITAPEQNTFGNFVSGCLSIPTTIWDLWLTNMTRVASTGTGLKRLLETLIERVNIYESSQIASGGCDEHEGVLRIMWSGSWI